MIIRVKIKNLKSENSNLTNLTFDIKKGHAHKGHAPTTKYTTNKNYVRAWRIFIFKLNH
jgi:hypothetical protein